MEVFKIGFGGLLRFGGREPRRQFWPWFAIVYVIMSLIGMIGAVPMMNGIFREMQQLAREHREDLTVASGPTSYSMSVQGLMPDLTPFMVGMGVSLAVLVVLLAAAVTRRLHDGGKPGWLGLLPLPFLVTPFYIMPRLFGAMDTGAAPPIDLFWVMMINNLAYFVMLGIMVILLVLKSTPGPNRYGPEPEPRLPRQPA